MMLSHYMLTLFIGNLVFKISVEMFIQMDLNRLRCISYNCEPQLHTCVKFHYIHLQLQNRGGHFQGPISLLNACFKRKGIKFTIPVHKHATTWCVCSCLSFSIAVLAWTEQGR